MGRLSPVVDFTGGDLVGQHAQSIKDMIDEVNRQQEHLDSLVNSLIVIASGLVVIPYDAPSNSYPDTIVPLASGMVGAFISYMVRSDQASKAWSLPYFELSSGNVNILANAYMNSSTGQLLAGAKLAAAYASPPANLTFYYYLLQQPANATLT